MGGEISQRIPFIRGEDKMTRVRCYAGSTYPERPEAFEWEGAEKQVARIL
jgi:hypothetical protein